MDKIKTIIMKEWSEVFKNRLVLFSVAFLPLILTIMPLVMIYFMNGATAEIAAGDSPPDEFFGAMCEGMTEAVCTQVYTLNIFTLMFMLLPVSIPVTIAAYSIVGEKASRSLEPLLATPITTVELLAGKTISAIVPAIGATWVGFGLYLVGARLMVEDAVFQYLVQPMWLIAIFLVGPLLTLLAVSIAIMISSRVTDPRVAEQLSAVVVLPIILLMISQSVGWLLLDQTAVLIIGGALVLIDALLVYISVRMFHREAILTRWK